MKKTIQILSLLMFTSCANLYHVQIGNVDDRAQDTVAWIPIDVKLSEVGIDTQQIADLTRTRSKDPKTGQYKNDTGIADIVGLFQMGPRTGLQVYNERYAEKVIYQLYQQCPSGRITGVSSIREHRNYSVVSGEIVKITAYCLKPRS